MENVSLALFYLGGGEIAAIIGVLVIMATVLGTIVWFGLRATRKSSAPSEARPPVVPLERRPCPNCAALLPPGAPEDLCPACLLRQGIGTQSGVPGQAPFTPPSISELVKLFPQLEILEPIGKGGMGAVYKARQPQLDRLVALKILAPKAGSDADFTGRFTREARALARLNHPNIVAVYDFGEINNLNYFIMEYVDGLNLRQVQQSARLSTREALEIVPQICAALQFAHDEGIVHRDIKPENVLLDKKGRVKIADFGLAKILGQEPQQFRLTGARDVVGTPHYMAPEQVEKPQEVDHRADIYSLGVVFYELLTGELPLGKFQPPSEKVQVDVRLDEVVMRSLAKEPARRYQHASDVKTEVETIVTTPSRPIPNPQPQHPMNKNKTVILGLAAICILALAILSFVFWLSHSRTNPAAAQAEAWQLWQSGHPADAAPKFQQAVKLAPEDANAWNGLGWSLFNSGHAAEAEKAFRSAIDRQPDHPAALNGLGQIYLAQGKYDDAETWLLKAAPQASAAWYGLARLYLIQGKFEQAEEYARKVVDSGQGDAVAGEMLQAARDKKVPDSLMRRIAPR